MTSKDLTALGVIDHVIPEPLGGAHRDHHLTASRLKSYLRNTLRQLMGRPIDQLLEDRYQKFRRMGVFLEHSADGHLRLNGHSPHGQPHPTAEPRYGNLTAEPQLTGEAIDPA